MKKNKENVKEDTTSNISFEDYKRGFKGWKESTATSSIDRQLGHHHILLASDGVQYNDNKKDFGENMVKIHHKITSITLLNSSSLE